MFTTLVGFDRNRVFYPTLVTRRVNPRREVRRTRRGISRSVPRPKLLVCRTDSRRCSVADQVHCGLSSRTLAAITYIAPVRSIEPWKDSGRRWCISPNRLSQLVRFRSYRAAKCEPSKISVTRRTTACSRRRYLTMGLPPMTVWLTKRKLRFNAHAGELSEEHLI